MRKSKAETAKTREHILEVAADQFMAHGINDAGLARVMKAAGLTHGGFYRHFSSKDELVAEACRKAFSSLTADLDSEGDLAKIVGEYLSRNHRDNPRTGCPLATVGSELARSDTRTRREATEGFLRIVQVISRRLKRGSAKEIVAQATAIAAVMVGAVTLARIVPDPRLSTSILAAAEAQILEATRKMR